MEKTVNNSHVTIIRALSAFVILISILIGYQSWSSARRAQVVIEWSTASELDTAGFNIYRSQHPEGPFEKVNVHLIPASNDPLVGDSYEYEDVSVIAGNTYFYQLEDVAFSGETTRHGPIEIEAHQRGTMELIIAGILALLGFAGFSAGPRYL